LDPLNDGHPETGGHLLSLLHTSTRQIKSDIMNTRGTENSSCMEVFMIDLKLSNNERKVLDETLVMSLNQLRDEISHTDSTEYRDMLKKRKEILLKIQSRLH
jgi:hypothetical protein